MKRRRKRAEISRHRGRAAAGRSDAGGMRRQAGRDFPHSLAFRSSRDDGRRETHYRLGAVGSLGQPGETGERLYQRDRDRGRGTADSLAAVPGEDSDRRVDRQERRLRHHRGRQPVAWARRDRRPLRRPHRLEPGQRPLVGNLRERQKVLLRVRRQIYADPCEADAVGFAYRKDLFEDPKEKADFKAKYKYDLAPPKTWPQLRDIAEFFTRPDKKLYG